MMKVPEENRVQEYGGNDRNGVFVIPLSGRTHVRCMASDGAGWEHVSIVAYDNKNGARTPTWAEMNKIKDIFWSPEDCVVQFHPPKEDYVNNHPFCLHLWRPIGVEIPRPPKELVGIVN